MTPLPPYVTRDLVLERLPLIFPTGVHNRSYMTREIAASVVFTHLYIGAVEGAGIYLGPVQIYRMTDEQSALPSDEDRILYRDSSRKKKFKPAGERWYEDNTREPIRDESIKEGLLNIGAVLELPGMPTTSSKPRYYLKADFGALFDPKLTGVEFETTVAAWQGANLSTGALARLRLAGLGAKSGKEDLLVTFPNGDTRKLTSGPSANISRAVIEVFAKHFLKQPGVLWLSSSDDKVGKGDDELAASINLKIDAGKNLPDIILVDLEPAHPLLIFIEVVATDGAITERRQKVIYEITDAAGFARNHILFVTAYNDRDSPGFLKTIKSVGWNSYVWFASEPEKLVIWKDKPVFLSSIIDF